MEYKGYNIQIVKSCTLYEIKKINETGPTAIELRGLFTTQKEAMKQIDIISSIKKSANKVDKNEHSGDN